MAGSIHYLQEMLEKAKISRKNGECPTCSEKINMSDFPDQISLREFRISGMCQSCQDKTFVDPGE